MLTAYISTASFDHGDFEHVKKTTYEMLL